MANFVYKIKRLLSKVGDKTESLFIREDRMYEDFSELNDILKRVCFKYICSIIVIFFLFAILYCYEDIAPLNYLTCFYAIFHLFFFFIPYRLEYESIRPLLPIYFIFLSLVLFPVVALFWQIGQITAFFWYFLLLFASALFFSSRSTVYWAFYILLFICLVFSVADFIPPKYGLLCTPHQLAVINMMTILVSLYLVFFFSFYLNQINQIKIKRMAIQEPVYDDQTEEKKETDKEKYDKIYQNIMRYFEKTKPYCDSEFTISQLAIVLNTNVTYISKAIKIKEGVNFNVFINTHRVNKVKNMLQDDYHNKYTMRYIYTSSGFKHQSTFNKVFKQTEGITPSEYIKKLESDKN